MSADYKERLRRLALHDDHLIRSMLVIAPGHVEACGVDPKSCALVRLGALVALGAPCGSYSGASSGPWRPARPPMRLWTLMAVTPVTGVARVVAAAPEFALALASLLAASERTAIVAMPFTSSLLDGEMSGVEQVQLCS
jgi:hypothetical protein